jgi:hypothetical protein
LFADIRGFTTMAEDMNPAAVAALLNRFYEIASAAIFRCDGTLDKLVGDEVMAFFGAPLHSHDHPRRAVMSALEIMREVNAIAAQEKLEIGVGIATGVAFVGNVGSAGVTDYTVLGDTVNIAARLQSAAAPGEIPPALSDPRPPRSRQGRVRTAARAPGHASKPPRVGHRLSRVSGRTARRARLRGSDAGTRSARRSSS